MNLNFYLSLILSIYFFDKFVNTKDIKNNSFTNNNFVESNAGKKSYNKFLTNETKESLNIRLGSLEKSLKYLREFNPRILLNVTTIENNLKRSALQFLNSLNLTDDCLSAAFRWMDGLKRGELWAYQFIDSTGGIPSGLSEGVISSFGEYDECLGISSQSKDEGKSDQTIYGKYCLVKPILPINHFESLQNFNGIQSFNNKTNEWIKNEIKENVNKIKLLMTANTLTNKLYAFYLGICIPSQCQPKDVENVLRAVLQPIVPIPIDVGPKCDTINDRIEWNLFNIFIFSTPVLLTVLAILSTLYSLKFPNSSQQKNIYFHEIMKSFSLIESNKRLFTPFKDRFLIVDLLLLWIVLWIEIGMAYTLIVFSGSVGYKKLLNSFALNVVTDSKYFWLRTPFPRDTLFLLSGVVISANFFTKNIRISFLSYLKFALEKWYRFLPKMIGAIVLENILMSIGDGPMFSTKSVLNVCDQKFWKNFLFIHQIVSDVNDMCVQSASFYSIMFQLHIISPLFMIPFAKSLKFGLVFNTIAIIVLSFAKIFPKLFLGFELIPFEISKLNEVKQMKQMFVHNVFFPNQYLNVFIIGIILGYLLRKRPQLIDKLTKTRSTTIFFSIISYSLSILSIVWSENFKDINEEKNQLNLIMWFVTGNYLWSAGILWTIFLFYKTEKGALYKLMSNRIFAALVRLTMSILVNFSIINICLSFMKRDNVVISHSNQIQIIYIDMSLTLIICYLIYILLESPFIHILETIKNRRHFISNRNNLDKLYDNNNQETSFTFNK